MLNLRIDDESGSRSVPLPGGPVIVGRGESAAIRLTEVKASREHLEIRPLGNGVVVRDLGSTNGTFTEDRRILKARLGSGDAFRIGDTWITLEAEPSRSERQPRKTPVPAILLTLLAPALVLLILGELGVSAIASARQEKIDSAMLRIERVEFEMAGRESDPEKAVAALARFTRRYPRSRYAPEADRRQAEILPTVRRMQIARQELAELEAGTERYAFEELYYRYEKLYESYRSLPEIAARIGSRLADLDRTHREKLVAMVDAVREEATSLAAKGEYGRAVSALTSFTVRTPAAAASFREEIRSAEAELMRRAEKAYRELTANAEGLARDGKTAEAAALLRREAPRFLGIRFSAFLRLRADDFDSRGRPRSARKETVDQLTLRRSYYLLAQEAEELAAAGLFTRAAGKYRGILESIALPEVRKEFSERSDELFRLSALIADVRGKIKERGSKFGSVNFSGTRVRVKGIVGDTLQLEIAKQPITRQWDSLEPRELLALFRRARLTKEQRLDVAVYCFDMNLAGAFEEEILAALGEESLKEKAGRLYAHKRGVRYPEGGFVAYKGRILTGAQYAEEVHKEQVVKLRVRQVELLERIQEQPVMKKLARMRELRLKLDKARKVALALIFDEQTYFYPYRDRMAEYIPVQKEVSERVAVVRDIWDNPLKISTKSDRSVSSLLDEADESVRALRDLGIDPTAFADRVAAIRLYLGRTFTIRNYFHDQAELDLFTYNDHVLAYNKTVESVAKKLERRQVAVTNAYRLMMGRNALVLHDLLVRTARGHSDEMNKLGYFSHFSPTEERRTPNMRAKLEGYKATALSENIHRGSGTPEGAHDSWIHSSGHHRNILQKFWTEMGTGQVGKFWTQNFGRSRFKQFDQEDKNEKK